MAPPHFARSASALWHRTSRTTLVSPAAGSQVLELTGITALVWEVLGDPVSIPDLAADLAHVFGREASAIEPEVDALLAGLVAAGAVQQTP